MKYLNKTLGTKRVQSQILGKYESGTDDPHGWNNQAKNLTFNVPISFTVITRGGTKLVGSTFLICV